MAHFFKKERWYTVVILINDLRYWLYHYFKCMGCSVTRWLDYLFNICPIWSRLWFENRLPSQCHHRAHSGFGFHKNSLQIFCFLSTFRTTRSRPTVRPFLSQILMPWSRKSWGRCDLRLTKWSRRSLKVSFIDDVPSCKHFLVIRCLVFYSYSFLNLS